MYHLTVEVYPYSGEVYLTQLNHTLLSSVFCASHYFVQFKLFSLDTPCSYKVVLKPNGLISSSCYSRNLAHHPECRRCQNNDGFAELSESCDKLCKSLKEELNVSKIVEFMNTIVYALMRLLK